MEILRTLIGPDDNPSPAQFAARGVIIFVLGIAFIRMAGRRSFSQSTPLDIIVAVIVGSNLSRVMTGKVDTLGGILATLVVVVLHRALAMASLRWGWLSRCVKCTPVVLVRGGVADHETMRRHGISDVDLMEGLRLQQVEALSDVKLATLEGGGKVSVVKQS